MVETDKYIEVADGNFERKTNRRISNMRDDKGKPFIATLYKVLFAPGLCDRLFFHYYVYEFGTYLPFS